MKDYDGAAVRNLGFFGHGGCGKTSICESLLYSMGQNTRLGSVTDGTSLLDYDEDEVRRKIGINLSLGYGEHRGVLLNFIDAPGYADFVGNVVSAVRAADIGVVVVDAASGIEVGTEMAWRKLERAGLPRVVFVSKLGRENADFGSAAEEVRNVLGASVTPLFLPVGKESGLSGAVDLLNDRAYGYQDGRRSETPIPEGLGDVIAKWKERLAETAADVDEQLMEKYLEGKSIEPDELRRAIRTGIRSGRVFPMLGGDALRQVGTDLLLDVAVDVLPSALDLPDVSGKAPGRDGEVRIARKSDDPACAFVFKTMSEAHVGEMNYVRVFSGSLKVGGTVLNATTEREEKLNQIYLVKGRERTEVAKLTAGMVGALVKLKDTHTGDTLCERQRPVRLPDLDFPKPSISEAIVPKTKGDEERVSNGLARLHEEDPTFSYEYNRELGQQLVHGMGELHLDVIVDRLSRRFDVHVELKKPRIAYRETITRKAEAQGRHKKQTGGRGQFGDVWLRVEPRPRGEGFEFVDEVFGGAIPSKYIPAVQKGIVETMDKGILAGYQMTDIKATVYDGSFHPVDSSDIAFKLAGSLAFKSCCHKAGLVLLEPIANVEITVPDRFTGDVIGDLNSRRGRIMGMEAQGNLQVVKAQVPIAEMYKYSNSLRSMTQGRGHFGLELAHYEEVPRELAAKVVEDAKRAREDR